MPSNEQFDTVATIALEPCDHTNHHRNAITDNEHMTFNETAAWLRCSTRTLQRLLETGNGPPVIRISERRLIFHKMDLRNWVAGRTTRRTEIPPPRRPGQPRKLPEAQVG